jgi:glycerol-3-phosphate acyltransferase PlsY
MGPLLLVLAAYLCGSIPIGLIVGRLAGVDPRSGGSGNIGATNVARLAGWTEGLLTLAGDAAKGAVPVLLSTSLGFDLWVAAAAGMAAFLGHLYPLFLGFRGGKGVATAAGVLLAVAPLAALSLIGVFALVAAGTRLVSLASLFSSLLAPALLWFLSYPPPLVALAGVLALLIVLRHRTNIERLLAGAEPRFTVNSR